MNIKILSAVAALTLVCQASTLSASAQPVSADSADVYAVATLSENTDTSLAASEDLICGDFTYSLSDGTAVITGYTGSSSALEIPEQLDSVSVTAIADNAFTDCGLTLTDITLPKSIEAIGTNALGYYIVDGTAVKNTALVIHCYTGSAAESYADDNGFQKEIISEISSIDGAEISGISSSYTYSMKNITPVPTVKLGDTLLTKDTDYTVAYKSNRSVGTATVTITGIGNYSGTVTTTFTITAADISKTTVSGVASSYEYTGSAITPSVTVKNGNTVLVTNRDYTVSYKNNVNKGTATVTITGKGNYSGTLSKTYSIKAVKLSDCKISGIKSSYSYKAKALKPTVTVKHGSQVLVKGTDYTVSCKNNVNKGTATVTIKGIGKYTGTVKKTFKITAAKLSSCKITGLKKYYKYTGTSRKPSFKVTLSGKTLKKGTDYTVTYKNNVKKGTATITIKGKGNCTGTVKKTFKIVRQGWYTSKGYTYYFKENGKKATGLTTVGKNTYCFNEKGVMVTGWQKLSDGNYYFFNRKSGKRVVGKEVDGITIGSDGSVEKSSYNVSKIDTMITAHNLANQICKPTDSIETKRLKCFKWVFQFPYHRFRTLAPIYKNAGWEITFANDIFKYKSGCCVSEASAVAFLFHEIGYETVYVAHDTGHAWVELNGRVYDPLFAEDRGMSGNYNALIPNGVYRSNPVQRRKI